MNEDDIREIIENLNETDLKNLQTEMDKAWFNLVEQNINYEVHNKCKKRGIPHKYENDKIYWDTWEEGEKIMRVKEELGLV